MVTLLDPSRLWASQVVHALSDAAGQPVQRLNLRERATLLGWKFSHGLTADEAARAAFGSLAALVCPVAAVCLAPPALPVMP